MNKLYPLLFILLPYVSPGQGYISPTCTDYHLHLNTSLFPFLAHQEISSYPLLRTHTDISPAPLSPPRWEGESQVFLAPPIYADVTHRTIPDFKSPALVLGAVLFDAVFLSEPGYKLPPEEEHALHR